MNNCTKLKTTTRTKIQLLENNFNSSEKKTLFRYLKKFFSSSDLDFETWQKIESKAICKKQEMNNCEGRFHV